MTSHHFQSCPCVKINGGECKNDTCSCPQGFSGRFCEFALEQAPNCEPACRNGGYCSFTSNEFESDKRPICQCPRGYAGETCQLDGASQCGTQNHTCHNAAMCVRINSLEGGEHDHCDCRTALTRNGKRFAGKYCEYEETATCDTAANIEERLFCVNGGQCKPEPSLGCDCPINYSGFSCEFYTGNMESEIPQPTNIAATTFCKLDNMGYVKDGTNAFCANDGECKALVSGNDP
jgi:hypothetical protein